MNNFLNDLALAHQAHEGYFPGSLAYKNNNPGNIRFYPALGSLYGATVGQGGFAAFPTYQEGLRALKDDLRAKIVGKSRHIDYRKNPIFLDYVKVFAPEGDHNDPVRYCGVLCSALAKYGVKPETPLTVLASLISGESSYVVPSPTIPSVPITEREVEILERRLANQKDPTMKGVTSRLISRLKNILKLV